MDAAPASDRVDGLDVLRGAAVALVVLNHGVLGARSVDLGAGVVGVAIFFTLSGYLITGVLLRGVQRDGRVWYGRFYRNRALRLLPPLVPVLLTYALVEPTTGALGDGRPWLSAVVGASYTADLPVLRDHTGALAHLWTLAIEEQFYLVWPVVLAFGLARGRARQVTLVALALALALPLVAATVVAHPASVHTLPTSWGAPLLLGAATALHPTRTERWAALPRAGQRLPTAAAVATVVGVSCVRDVVDSHLTYAVLVPLVSVSTVVLVLRLERCTSVGRAGVPIRALGTVSYAAYLWNLPVTYWAVATRLPPELAAAVAVLATLALATASWWLLERPVRGWRQRRDAAERAAGVAVPAPRREEPLSRPVAPRQP